MTKKDITIKLASGLEARPVAMLVQIASQFDSTIHIETLDKKVNAKSIRGMMSLGLDAGEKVTVVADGNDEENAVTSIEEYLNGTK